MHGSVTVHVDAPIDRVWSLISDVTQIGRFSPEVFEAEWIEGSTGPAVGARFRGHVKRNEKGPVYWTKCTVTACEAGKEFAFGVGEPGKALNTWSYRLEPSGEGTDVTESFRLTENLPLRIYWSLFGWSRGRRNVNDMRRTLEKVKAAAEAEGQA
jgi:uncharacterized protein YndB with AHSA1/START domain